MNFRHSPLSIGLQLFYCVLVIAQNGGTVHKKTSAISKIAYRKHPIDTYCVYDHLRIHQNRNKALIILKNAGNASSPIETDLLQTLNENLVINLKIVSTRDIQKLNTDQLGADILIFVDMPVIQNEYLHIFKQMKNVYVIHYPSIEQCKKCANGQKWINFRRNINQSFLYAECHVHGCICNGRRLHPPALIVLEPYAISGYDRTGPSPKQRIDRQLLDILAERLNLNLNFVAADNRTVVNLLQTR